MPGRYSRSIWACHAPASLRFRQLRRSSSNARVVIPVTPIANALPPSRKGPAASPNAAARPRISLMPYLSIKSGMVVEPFFALAVGVGVMDFSNSAGRAIEVALLGLSANAVTINGGANRRRGLHGCQMLPHQSRLLAPRTNVLQAKRRAVQRSRLSAASPVAKRCRISFSRSCQAPGRGSAPNKVADRSRRSCRQA